MTGSCVDSFDKRLLSRVCPDCGVPMKPEPRTVIGGRAGPGQRFVYDNCECVKCGMKVAYLVKDRLPAGDA